MRNFGYKVCYTENNSKKLKVHLVTNDYEHAIWRASHFEKYQQYDRKTKAKIKSPTWYVLPVKNKFEFKKLWKGCPIKLSSFSFKEMK